MGGGKMAQKGGFAGTGSFPTASYGKPPAEVKNPAFLSG
jgi:hypothetical protein